VRLVLLDFGIADELPSDVRDRFLTFLFSLARQDGVAAANCLLTWSDAQTCVGAQADGLRADIAKLVDERCALREGSVDIDDVLKRVMTILRARGVAVDAVFASLVVSMCVLVGFATALDENLNLFEVAIAAFLSWSVTGDVAGKLYA
jgi:aarF domain-containing kinase